MGWVVFLSFFSVLNGQTRIAMQGKLDFLIAPASFPAKKIYYAYQYVKPEKFADHTFVGLDIENFAQQGDVLVYVSKFAFIGQQPLAFFNAQQLLNTEEIGKIFRADKVDVLGDEPPTWHVKLTKKVYFVSQVVNFDYYPELFGEVLDKEGLDQPVIQAALEFDDNLGLPSAMMIQRMRNFDSLFRDNLIVSKYYPWTGDQTLIVAYQITTINNASIRKLNRIPFVNARRVLVQQFQKELFNLKQYIDQ